MTINGQCLCKGVEFTISTESKHFDCCHCSMCRRWSGGPGFGVEAKGGVQFKDDRLVKVFSSSE